MAGKSALTYCYYNLHTTTTPKITISTSHYFVFRKYPMCGEEAILKCFGNKLWSKIYVKNLMECFDNELRMMKTAKNRKRNLVKKVS
jgi:predicted RNA-binding Zn-ribbon protein involved in translation (DUF1610 family)